MQVTALATGDKGSTAIAVMYFPTDPGYRDTARMLVEAGLVLALEPHRTQVTARYSGKGVVLGARGERPSHGCLLLRNTLCIIPCTSLMICAGGRRRADARCMYGCATAGGQTQFSLSVQNAYAFHDFSRRGCRKQVAAGSSNTAPQNNTTYPHLLTPLCSSSDNQRSTCNARSRAHAAFSGTNFLNVQGRWN